MKTHVTACAGSQVFDVVNFNMCLYDSGASEGSKRNIA